MQNTKLAIALLLGLTACRDGLMVPTGEPDAGGMCFPTALVVPGDDDPSGRLGLYANLVALEARSVGAGDGEAVRDAAWAVLDRFPSPAREALEPHTDEVAAAIHAELAAE